MANGETNIPETDLSVDRTSGEFDSVKSAYSGQIGRILVVILAVVVLAIIGYWVWQKLAFNVATANLDLQVSGVQMDKQTVKADGLDFATAKITILSDNNPASEVWVGLKLKNSQQTTDEFDYFGWYSAEPNQSFYKADQNGAVTIPIKSKVAGNITYDIYATDPNQKNQKSDYTNLNFSFPLTFE